MCSCFTVWPIWGSNIYQYCTCCFQAVCDSSPPPFVLYTLLTFQTSISTVPVVFKQFVTLPPPLCSLYPVDFSNIDQYCTCCFQAVCDSSPPFVLCTLLTFHSTVATLECVSHSKQTNFVPTASLLFQIGVDVNAVDSDGWTALHAAAHWGQKEACEILANHGAGFNIRNKAVSTVHCCQTQRQGLNLWPIQSQMQPT